MESCTFIRQRRVVGQRAQLYSFESLAILPQLHAVRQCLRVKTRTAFLLSTRLTAERTAGTPKRSGESGADGDRTARGSSVPDGPLSS